MLHRAKARMLADFLTPRLNVGLLWNENQDLSPPV